LNPTLLVDVAEPEIVRPESVVVPKPLLDTLSHGFVVEPTQSENTSPAVEFTERRADGEVVPTPRRPDEVKVEVAMPPNDAVLALMFEAKKLVDDAFVVVSPPFKARSVVVAAEGNGYAKFA
jgi:hypothetical protein